MSISLEGAHHNKQHARLKDIGHCPPSALSTLSLFSEGALPHKCDSLMPDGLDRLHGVFPLQLRQVTSGILSHKSGVG